MPSFKDLSEFVDPYLPLPISGKVYRVPSPSVDVGLRSQAIVALSIKVQTDTEVTPEDIAALKLDDEGEVEFNRTMLSPEVYDQMVADEVPWEYVQHAAKTVFMWVVGDRDKAAEVWASLGKPKRPAPKDRRAPAKKTRKNSRSS